MKFKRNTEGLSKAAKKRREVTIAKVKQAIDYLVKRNEPINFNSVSKTAKVGKPWLYKEEDVYKKIIFLREQSHNINKKEHVSIKKQTSEKSKENIIIMLKEKIKKNEDENNKLKSQIEILYGKLCMLDKDQKKC